MMDEQNGNSLIERRKRRIINFAYYALLAAIFYVVFRYVIYMAGPFVVALIVTLLLRRPIRFISRKLHLPHKGAAALVIAFFYIIVAGLIVLAVIEVAIAVANWMSELPSIYADYVEPYIARALEWYEEKATTLDPTSGAYVDSAISSITDSITRVITWLSNRAVSFGRSAVLGIPKALIATIFCVVATVFMSMDYNRMRHFFYAQLSEDQVEIVKDSVTYISVTMLKLIVSYMLIMLITMSELFIGLSLIGISNALTIAIVIGVFDIIPALGTGGILLPWAVVVLVNGNYGLAIKLVVLYVIITLVRNFMEPKIVGDSIGVHPVLMLLSMYLGARLFGALGIIILPFTILVVKKLNDSDRIHLFKSDYFADAEEQI